MLIIIASIAVGLVAFILYALERKSQGEPISWEHALKLSLFGGLVTAGVVFATTAESVTNVVMDTVSTVASVADSQEMFVGTPSF